MMMMMRSGDAACAHTNTNTHTYFNDDGLKIESFSTRVFGHDVVYLCVMINNMQNWTTMQKQRMRCNFQLRRYTLPP